MDVVHLLRKRVLFIGDSITERALYIRIIEYVFRTLFSEGVRDFKSIGLGGETASGLSESNHAYYRSCIHSRLDCVLSKIRPEVLIVCYGMNDGIYHPFSEDRFQAYQNGILKIIRKSKIKGVKQFILLTPPPFDPLTIQFPMQREGAEDYGYINPYQGYNEVLGRYAQWIMSLNESDVFCVDLHTPFCRSLEERRRSRASFSYSDDGIHPRIDGHYVMATAFLKAFKIEPLYSDVDQMVREIEGDELFQKIMAYQEMRSRGWLEYIGYEKETIVKRDRIEDIEGQVEVDLKSLPVSKTKLFDLRS